MIVLGHHNSVVSPFKVMCLVTRQRVEKRQKSISATAGRISYILILNMPKAILLEISFVSNERKRGRSFLLPSLCLPLFLIRHLVFEVV